MPGFIVIRAGLKLMGNRIAVPYLAGEPFEAAVLAQNRVKVVGLVHGRYNVSDKLASRETAKR